MIHSDYGAHPDTKDKDRWTPLHRAVQKDNFEAVDRLLSAGTVVRERYGRYFQFNKFFSDYFSDLFVRD